MNRKNLTAAVLAGLAGAAGLAGTAQAVNLNPDGLGQVLIYPYYTTNGGNQTILSVVNTTDEAKAVKVRFLEGYNSREVLDFNLYLSKHDVWVAGVFDDAGKPSVGTPDTSCTVPYIYGDFGGKKDFFDYAYTGDREDDGPTDLLRGSEGHIEMIEMGVLTNESARAPKTNSSTDPGRIGSAAAATHTPDGVPADCDQLVRAWTNYSGASGDKLDPQDGQWYDDMDSDGQVSIDTKRNTGGLFGGAAIVNADNGTMYSYDAKAIQGYDKSSYGVHFVPGLPEPSLNSGNQYDATVFFGTPTNEAVTRTYARGVDAISAVFMHDNLMNTYTIIDTMSASTEWVFTFPTKSFYVDKEIVKTFSTYKPDPDDAGCKGWTQGEPYPHRDGKTYKDQVPGPGDTGYDDTWEQCTYLKYTFTHYRPPFTGPFDGEACETVYWENWDREESTPGPSTGSSKPPIFSPPPPSGPKPTPLPPFELCYEVNVLRFGDGVIFDTPEIEGQSLLTTVDFGDEAGWARVSFSDVDLDDESDTYLLEWHQDENGLVGLPVTGFSAEEFENNYVGGGSVLAYYGGLYQHKGSVRSIDPNMCEYADYIDAPFCD